MARVKVLALDDSRRMLEQEAVDALAAELRGALLLRRSPGYDAARSIWNGMIDRRPALIARCEGAADVMHAVRFARRHDIRVAVRGGGHNIAGNAVADDALVIDLSLMRAVRVDPGARTARAEPGCTLRDLDHETQAFGLATPLGINSTTGVAGLTLGGGFGWLSRMHGLTVDNLESVDLVTARGELVRASDSDNAELFWALRGGGGNFGIATSFEYRLHTVGPQILAGFIVHPLANARGLLRYFRSFTADAPDALTTWIVLRKAPPLPFVPKEWHGREVAVVAVFYGGPDAAQGERLLEPLRRHGNPVGEFVAQQPYTAWQQVLDPLLTPGARNYWKSHDFTELSDGAIDTFIEYAGRLPSPQCEILIVHLGGAINRVATDATAYPHRDVQYLMNVHGRWDDASDDEKGVAWSRALFRDTSPHATGGVYVNFMPEDETGRVQAAYGANHERLARLKRQWDPDNFFRLNQNIPPSA